MEGIRENLKELAASAHSTQVFDRVCSTGNFGISGVSDSMYIIRK